MNKYTPIIGLEVHVELKTASKMFCRCSADYFGKEPNTHTCPVCLGLPGALPVPNKKAIEWCIKIALALRCEINTLSKFDRKNYYYPDLAKGYQISQYDQPFGKEGSMLLSTGKTIRIRRVHMEEDTAKLTHGQLGISNGKPASPAGRSQIANDEKMSLIDFNRSGVPLVEIVTEPDFTSAAEVTEYLQKLQKIVRHLDVSNADMEKGDMRLEPNISLTGISNIKYPISDDQLPHYKVEVKNINSFRFVEKAIEFEITRQAEILDRGEIPLQETRGWNETKNITFSQRVKEEAMDYRYFPEPDIPPIRFTDEEISTIRASLPELQDEKIARFTKQFELSEYNAEILTREKSQATFFEDAVKIGNTKNLSPKQIANFIINKKISASETTPEELVKMITSASQTVQVDEKELEKIIRQVLKEHPKAVDDFQSGKENVIMFLVGQVMRNAKQKPDAQMIKEKILSELKK